MKDENSEFIKIIIKIAAVILVLVCVGMVGCPQYNVYSQRMEGEARLAHAHSERQIQVQDAQSKYEAAKDLARAEVERAKGVAEANKIIGDSLKSNEAYLRYLYINNLEKAGEKGTEIIYIPTEAGLPILEAGKRK